MNLCLLLFELMLIFLCRIRHIHQQTNRKQIDVYGFHLAGTIKRITKLRQTGIVGSDNITKRNTLTNCQRFLHTIQKLLGHLLHTFPRQYLKTPLLTNITIRSLDGIVLNNHRAVTGVKSGKVSHRCSVDYLLIIRAVLPCWATAVPLWKLAHSIPS